MARSVLAEGCSGAPTCPSGYANWADVGCELEPDNREALTAACVERADTASCDELEAAELAILEVFAKSFSTPAPPGASAQKAWLTDHVATLDRVNLSASHIVDVYRPASTYAALILAGHAYANFADAVVGVSPADLDPTARAAFEEKMMQVAQQFWAKADESWAFAEQMATDGALGEARGAEARRLREDLAARSGN